MASHPDPTDNGEASPNGPASASAGASRPSTATATVPPLEEPKSGVLPTVTSRMSAVPSARHDSAPDWSPDSSVPSSVPVARVALARQPAEEESSVTRALSLTLLVRLESSAPSAPYVTLSLPGGRVAFEGSTDRDGRVEVALLVPVDTKEIRVLVEHGTKYRHATIPLLGREHVDYELG